MVAEKIVRTLFHTQDIDLISKLCEIAEIEVYKKGDDIYRIGEQYVYCWILLEGIVYSYFYDAQQRMITTCFFNEKNDFLNMGDYYRPSTIGMKALTDTTIFKVSIEKARMLAAEFPELMWEYAEHLQKTMIYLCVLNNRRMYFTAEERYQWFLEYWPDIERLATNQQVATFLRMRPESLSRLKSQMRQSGNTQKNLTNILVTKDMQWDYMDIKEMMEKSDTGKCVGGG